MKLKTIRTLTAVFASLLILSAVFFWLELSLEAKFSSDSIRIYMFNDFSAAITIFLSVIILVLQLIKPKTETEKNEVID
jgi:hypothetical protein